MRHACRQGKRIATFAPPSGANPGDWEGNILLLGSDPPWPDRNLRWQPARALTCADDMIGLLAHEIRQFQVDASPMFSETRKPEQPRLLEERATYDGDE